MTRRDPQPDPRRRRFCRHGLYLLGGGLAISWLPGCAGDAAQREPAETRVLLALIPGEGRVAVDHAGVPVEIQRRGSGYLVRSLLCTHQGCRIRWEAETGTYLCPCHNGRFDEQGKPVQGPPRRALRIYAARVDGSHLVISDSTSSGADS